MQQMQSPERRAGRLSGSVQLYSWLVALTDGIWKIRNRSAQLFKVILGLRSSILAPVVLGLAYLNRIKLCSLRMREQLRR